MFNNRLYINQLKKDLEIKEDSIQSLLDKNQALALDNQEYRVRNKNLQEVIEHKDLKICELNIKLVRVEKQLEKIDKWRIKEDEKNEQ